MYKNQKQSLPDDKIDKIIEYVKNAKHKEFLGAIKPIREILETQGIDEQKMYEDVFKEEIEDFVSEINLRMRGIGSKLDKNLPNDEKAYLAGILHLKEKLNTYPVISSFIYEVLRSGNLIQDTDQRRRSTEARNVLMRLKEKGLVKEIEVNHDIPQPVTPTIRYVYTLCNGKFVSSIQNLPEYELLNERRQKIAHDHRVLDTIKRYNNSLQLIKEQNGGIG